MVGELLVVPFEQLNFVHKLVLLLLLFDVRDSRVQVGKLLLLKLRFREVFGVRGWEER